MGSGSTPSLAVRPQRDAALFICLIQALLLQTPSVRRMSSGSSDVIVMPMSSVLGGANFRLQVSAFFTHDFHAALGSLRHCWTLRMTDWAHRSPAITASSSPLNGVLACRCRQDQAGCLTAQAQQPPHQGRPACLSHFVQPAKSLSSAARAMLNAWQSTDLYVPASLVCRGPHGSNRSAAGSCFLSVHPRVQDGIGGSNASYTLPNASAASGHKAPKFSCRICSKDCLLVMKD